MTTDTTVLDGLDFPTPRLAVADDVADLLFREARTAAAFTPDEVSDFDDPDENCSLLHGAPAREPRVAVRPIAAAGR